jgi:thiamine pyrophosphokinase
METTVILADGAFPVHIKPLEALKSASRIICCDGSVEALVRYGLEPSAIVGDMDSISPALTLQYADRIFIDKNQETNDLTKAVLWCAARDYKDLLLVGATGKRDDHSIGNISLLAEYAEYCSVKLLTDTGTFIFLNESSVINSIPGQQISVFSINPDVEISSEGLKYPLNRRRLRNWWEGTLNEALGDKFRLNFSKGRVLVYLKYTI